jgi:hypothetical protein
MTRRGDLRTALATALTGLATTGTRVFVNPPRVLQETDLPALVLRDGAEEIAETGIDGLPVRAHWRFQIDLVAKAATGGTDLIDSMVDETLAAVASSSSDFAALDAQCNWHGGAGNLDIDTVADKPVYVYPIALEIIYIS